MLATYTPACVEGRQGHSHQIELHDGQNIVVGAKPMQKLLAAKQSRPQNMRAGFAHGTPLIPSHISIKIKTYTSVHARKDKGARQGAGFPMQKREGNRVVGWPEQQHDDRSKH